MKGEGVWYKNPLLLFAFTFLGAISGIWVIYELITHIKKHFSDRREIIKEIKEKLSEHEKILKNLEEEIKIEMEKLGVTRNERNL